MDVRIYKPTKNAMQSGRANGKKWIMDFVTGSAKRPDPEMGWIGGGDTREQLRLRFDSKQDAIAYAERKGYEFEVIEPKQRQVRAKAYADNFRYDRIL